MTDPIIETRGSAIPAPADNTSPAGYDRVAQAFHWVTAILILALVAIGLYCSWVGDGPTRTYLLEKWHKPFGLLVILLTIARLWWKASQPAVPEADGLALWESRLSRFGHLALYLVLFAMPLSGLLMSQGAGRPTPFFGLFDIPQVLSVDPALGPREQPAYKLGKWLHETVVEWTLYLIVGLHVLGVIKHQIIDGNRAFIGRMWSWRR